MTKIFFILLILIIFLNGCEENVNNNENQPKNVFYVDSINGNDSFSGNSENSAWKTFQNINNHVFNPKDTIYLKKGSVFYDSLFISSSGLQEKYITFDSYGTGNNPEINGSVILTNWIEEEENIYSKQLDSILGKTGLGNISVDKIPLNFVAWDVDYKTTLNNNSNVFTFNPVTNTYYIRLSDLSSPDDKLIESSHELFGVYADGMSYIKIKNINLTRQSLHGMSFKNSHHIEIENCNANFIGGAVILTNPVIYAGNGFEFSGNSYDCLIKNSSAVNIFDSGFSPQTFDSNTSINNITYENCVAEKCGFAGIEISVLNQNNSSNETISNVNINNCSVFDSGKGWSGKRYNSEGYGIKIKADLNAGTISNISIEQTSVFNNEGAGIYISGECTEILINRNSVYQNKVHGIEVLQSTNVPINIKVTSNEIYKNNNSLETCGISYNVNGGFAPVFINNTFSENSRGLFLWNFAGEPVIKNNIFYATYGTHFYSPVLIEGTNIDYNCYYDFGDNLIGYNGIAYSDLNTYQTETGHDLNSIDENPLFINMNDFNLQNNSPVKNKGTNAGIIYDRVGNIFNNPPSMGAYQ